MASRMPKQPGHRRSGGLPREVVSAVVPEEEREQYLPFAQELYATFRRPPVPDFDRRTKLVVQKWFARGLSGHLLWRIGKQLVVRLFPAHGMARYRN